jgi:hypothetical protein
LFYYPMRPAIYVFLNFLLVAALAYPFYVVFRDTYRRSGRWNVFARRVSCPRCGLLMPVPRKPTSRRQMLYGGWTCEGCGCEMDANGVELLPGSPDDPSAS